MSTQTIHGMFEAYAAKNPEGYAVKQGRHSIRFGALNRKANQLARVLLRQGVCKEDIVAICMERSIEYFIAILATLKAGAAFVPLSQEQPTERLHLLLNDTKAPALLINDDIDTLFKDYKGPILHLGRMQTALSHQEDSNLDLDVSEQQLAYVIYTSGSTGTPKGVMIEHHSLVNYTVWFKEACQLSPQQRVEFSANHIFDLAITVSLSPIILGLTIVICPEDIKKSPRHYFEFLKEERIHFIKFTPAFLKTLLHECHNHPVTLPDIKGVMTGGELLMAADCMQWLTYFPEHVLYNEYGPTEATVGASILAIHPESLSPDSKAPIDDAGPHMHFTILDREGRPVPDGDTGELHIGGVCLARGYLNQPEKTKEKFINNPIQPSLYPTLYKTGDFFRKVGEHHFEYVGRMDHQVKIRGFRVEPDEVAHALLRHEAVHQAVVIAVNAPHGEKELIAYYVAKHALLNEETLRNDLAQHLPAYMLPSTFIALNDMPLNANGKIDRKALPQPSIIRHTLPYTAPTSTDQQILCSLWEKELGVAPIGIHHNFFELGGHSLAAARIISDINATLHQDIGYHDFFKYPTIAQCASHLKPLTSLQLDKHHKEGDQLPILSDFQLIFWLASLFRPRLKKLNVVSTRRFCGRLNIEKLKYALRRVTQQHDVFSYCANKTKPTFAHKSASFHLTVHHLLDANPYQKELALHTHYTALSQHYPWSTSEPNLRVNVFILEDMQFEIHLCMPHFWADELSMNILWQALDQFYAHNTPQRRKKQRSNGYADYLSTLHHIQSDTLAADLDFWKKYLHNVSLMPFKHPHIVHHMSAKGMPYSTYLPIPHTALKTLTHFCNEHQLSSYYGLCALALLAIKRLNVLEHQRVPFYLNLVKSTRNQSVYDHVIGCFLRTDGLKIDLNATENLLDIIDQLQNANLDTAAHQHCSSLIKLSNIHTFKAKNNLIKKTCRILVRAYASLFGLDKATNQVLQESVSMVATPYANHFLLNINIQQSFFNSSNHHNLLNSTSTQGHEPHHDLLQIDNCLDISFLKKEHQHQAYVVISANLEPSIRLKLAEEMLNIIHYSCPKSHTQEEASHV